MCILRERERDVQPWPPRATASKQKGDQENYSMRSHFYEIYEYYSMK